MILNSQKIDKRNWCYIEDNLLLVHQVYSAENEYIQTEQIKIPWKFIRQQLARHDHKKLK